MRSLLLWVIVCWIFFLSYIQLDAQEALITAYKVDIKLSQTISQTIKKLSEDIPLLVAYDGALSDIGSDVSVLLQSHTVGGLVDKICCVYGLECKEAGKMEYLIRKPVIELTTNIPKLVRVLHAQNGSPVEDVLVIDEFNQRTYFTDAFGDAFVLMNPAVPENILAVRKIDFNEGRFKISRPVSFYSVFIQAAPLKIPDILVHSPKPKILSSGQLHSYKSSLAGMEVMSVTSIFGKDILRTAQLYSGVNAIDDASANLRIRGSATEATQIMLDGMPVYKADHFYGILSSINGFYISDYSLYKNNIPVQYGGKTAGLLDISSGKQLSKKNLLLDLNTLYSALKADLPLGEHAGLSVAGRITYTDLATTGLSDLAGRNNISAEVRPVSNLVTVRPDFDFYDLNAKLYYTRDQHYFLITGFRSRDTFTDSRRLNFRTALFAANEEIFRQTNVWENTAASFQHTYTNNFHKYQTRFWYSGYDNHHETGGLYRVQRANETRVDTIRIENTNNISEIGFAWNYSNNASGILLGMEAITHQNQVFLENGERTLLEIDKGGKQFSIYGEKKINAFNERSELTPAFRLSYIPAFNRTYLLPQINYRYTFDSGIILKSAAGRHMQYIRLLEHENNLGQSQQFFALSNDGTVPVGLSWNAMTGMAFKREVIQIDAELYFRKLSGAITHATVTPGLRPPQQAPGFTDYRIFTGEARSYGMDLSVIYDKKPFFSMLSYSLSKSENRFREIFRNQYFPSTEDSRHQLKLVNTYTTGRWDFSVNYITATGRPYIDLTTIPNTVDRSRIVITDYIKNLSSYHRVDAGIALNFEWAGFHSRLGLSVFNLTNHRNVKYRQFIYRLPGQNSSINNTILGSDVTQLERTFNFNFTIKI